MGQYQVERRVPLNPTEAFRLWIDPGRAPQWQEQLLRIFDMSAGPAVPGCTYRLDYGPGLKRQATVLTSRPGEIHRVRASGAGWTDETTATFVASGDETTITVSIDLRMGLGFIGRLSERRMGRAGAEKKMNDELDRFVAVALRSVPLVPAGSQLSVDCGGRWRIATMLADDGDVVHVRLSSGVADQRPTDISELKLAARPPEPMAIQPIGPPFRTITDVVTSGQPLLALDGGVGVPHLALTRGALADALPESLGAEEELGEDVLSEIVAWREHNGPVGGRDPDFGIAAIVSYQMGPEFAGVAKLLRVETMTVHLRLYSDTWLERPSHVNPWTLRLDPSWAEFPGVGHVAVSLTAYHSIEPEYIRLAMVGGDELEGIREWRIAGGGKVGIRDVWRTPRGDECAPA